MKKLVSGFFCVSASAVFAAVTNVVATVDVIEVDSGLKNTIVAIPGLDLADGGKLAISNLVKTTGLANGDKLYAFSNEEYETWELQSGHWQKAAKRYTISSTGAVEVATTDASIMRMDVGSGIWLSRSTYTKGNPFYIYAAHVASPVLTVAAKSTALVGNPSLSDKTPAISGCAEGDVIQVPKSKTYATYTYNGKNWIYQKGFGEKGTGLPTILAGTGFWYISSSNATGDVAITWP